MKIKEQILELKAKGLTYNQIVSTLKCSKSLVSYYCGSNQKEKSAIRTRKLRAKYHPFQRKINRFAERDTYASQARTEFKRTKVKALYEKLRVFSALNGAKMITLEEVLAKFGETPSCYLTGKQIDIYNPREYQFDHIVPVSRGGSSTIDNMQISTKVANQAKFNLLPEEFLQLCKDVVTHAGYKIE